MRSLCFAAFALMVPSLVIAQQPAQPSDEHLRLKGDVGTWTGKMTLQVPGSDEPMTMDIKETNTMMDGGLWLLSDFEAGPFKGHAQIGYDAQKKKYVGTWIDNSSSHLSVMEGAYDAASHKMTMTFHGLDATSGELKPMKSVTTYQGKDKRHFVMYVQNDDKWVESFQMQYERAK
jgi:hypothetical protein